MKHNAAVRFTGSIQHTEDTIQRMYKTQYYTYEKLRMLLRMGFGAALAVIGVLSGFSLAWRGIMVLIGCWFLVSTDFPAVARADKALDQRKAELPQNVCTFYDNRMDLSGEGSMAIPYDRFQRLVEDDAYLYLFLEKNSLCMIEKATVTPEGSDALKAFVAQKTGLSWGRNRSILSMNVSDFLQMLRDSRKEKNG